MSGDHKLTTAESLSYWFIKSFMDTYYKSEVEVSEKEILNAKTTVQPIPNIFGIRSEDGFFDNHDYHRDESDNNSAHEDVNEFHLVETNETSLPEELKDELVFKKIHQKELIKIFFKLRIIASGLFGLPFPEKKGWQFWRDLGKYLMGWEQEQSLFEDILFPLLIIVKIPFHFVYGLFNCLRFFFQCLPTFAYSSITNTDNDGAEIKQQDDEVVLKEISEQPIVENKIEGNEEPVNTPGIFQTIIEFCYPPEVQDFFQNIRYDFLRAYIQTYYPDNFSMLRSNDKMEKVFKINERDELIDAFSNSKILSAFISAPYIKEDGTEFLKKFGKHLAGWDDNVKVTPASNIVFAISYLPIHLVVIILAIFPYNLGKFIFKCIPEFFVNVLEESNTTTAASDHKNIMEVSNDTSVEEVYYDVETGGKLNLDNIEYETMSLPRNARLKKTPSVAVDDSEEPIIFSVVSDDESTDEFSCKKMLSKKSNEESPDEESSDEESSYQPFPKKSSKTPLVNDMGFYSFMNEKKGQPFANLGDIIPPKHKFK